MGLTDLLDDDHLVPTDIIPSAAISGRAQQNMERVRELIDKTGWETLKRYMYLTQAPYGSNEYDILESCFCRSARVTPMTFLAYELAKLKLDDHLTSRSMGRIASHKDLISLFFIRGYSDDEIARAVSSLCGMSISGTTISRHKEAFGLDDPRKRTGNGIPVAIHPHKIYKGACKTPINDHLTSDYRSSVLVMLQHAAFPDQYYVDTAFSYSHDYYGGKFVIFDPLYLDKLIDATNPAIILMGGESNPHFLRTDLRKRQTVGCHFSAYQDLRRWFFHESIHRTLVISMPFDSIFDQEGRPMDNSGLRQPFIRKYCTNPNHSVQYDIGTDEVRVILKK